jgi:hypothetical protein
MPREKSGGRQLRTIAFEIPVEERIQGFSFSPDGTRVLLTTGGDRNDLWMAEGRMGVVATPEYLRFGRT